MQSNDKAEILQKIFIFFRSAARHPFLLFLLMLAIASAVAGWMFFDFNRIYLGGTATNSSAIAKSGVIFDRATADEFREVFSIMAQREKEYSAQSGTTTVSQAQN